MQPKNTRRGFTHEDKNAVIKNGHPRLESSGMTSNWIITRGFTLIELLVVVLIIAVLAAVALPQYNKVVKKAQGREVVAAFDALDKALRSYYLEHDTYEGISVDKLNIDIPELKHFRYSVGSCSPTNRTTQLTDDELVARQRGLNSFEVNPFLCMSNIAVNGRWENGKLESFSCADYSGPNWCHEYFDCQGTRTYQPQVTSTINNKEVILQEGHYVGSCVLGIHQ